jgi:modulator of FtsH protease HflK
MPWNKPGDDKDPWSGKGREDGPPDLDEVVKNLQEKFGGLFGGRGGGRRDNDGGSAGPAGPGMAGFGVIGGILFVVWLASGFYTVAPAEKGVVLRFGGYEEVTDPGLNWHRPYPIEEVQKVNVEQFSSFRHKAQMLTRDENIVDIELTVQFRVQNPVDYLFQDQIPDKTIRDATESVVRETIGKSDLDFILTEGRSSIADTIKRGVQELISGPPSELGLPEAETKAAAAVAAQELTGDNDKGYRTGLLVTSINMQPAKPPEQVKDAFDDAIKAREDKARLENKADAYAKEVVPTARGAAARRVEDAKAYREEVISEAEGEVSRFNAVLAEYLKAPEVTRQRLYLETVEEVLGKSNKVIVDVEGGNNLFYLPLDRLTHSGPLVQPTALPPASELEAMAEGAPARRESRQGPDSNRRGRDER